MREAQAGLRPLRGLREAGDAAGEGEEGKGNGTWKGKGGNRSSDRSKFAERLEGKGPCVGARGIQHFAFKEGPVKRGYQSIERLCWVEALVSDMRNGSDMFLVDFRSAF